MILTVKSDKDAQDILEYAEDLNWGKILTWFIPVNNTMAEYVKFLILRFRIWKFRYDYSNIEKIYFGSYVNQYHRSLLAEFEKKSKLFLLYDGLQIISTAHMRVEGPSECAKYPMLMRLMGFKSPQLRNLHFVSPISLHISDRDSLYLIRSSKILQPKYYDPNSIYFIGQPISSVGILNQEFYLETLKKIQNTYPDKKLIYIPHPREKEDVLAAITKIAEIMKPNVIFEKYFLKSTTFPQKVFSFYSSVLLNLVFLEAESEIISIRIPKSEIILKDFAQKVDPIYSYFETIPANNFKVIDMENNSF